MDAADARFLDVAVELAAQGMYSTTPNPRVGCLLVQDGRVIGRGYHVRHGSGHAEVNAIADARAAGAATTGATAYVSLEPCSFHSRTPPCVDALLDAGVTRVVAAATDPHPKVSGSGFSALRAAGVAVEVTELTAAHELNAGYELRVIENRPFVRLKAAASLDGRTAMASGESQWITGPEARSDVQYWRARSCAIVTGSGTVLADDPALTVRDPQFAVGDLMRQPLRVVLDSELRTDPGAKVYSAPNESVLVVHTQAATEPAQMRFDQLPTLCLGATSVELSNLLTELAARGCNEVLIEAGPRLLGAFLEQGLWDEMVLYLAPKFLGSSARPLFDVPLTHMAQAFNATIVESKAVAGDQRLRLRPSQR